jgi:hypothetical protein
LKYTIECSVCQERVADGRIASERYLTAAAQIRIPLISRVLDVSRVSKQEGAYMWDRITRAWCQAMHEHTTWPMHGRYMCTDCLREYPVAWDAPLHAPSKYATASVSIDVCV